jgi:hypothetical protein
MTDYTKSTNFATKDNLSSGNPLKIVKGTEIDTEFNNIQTAIATKIDSTSATISGATIDNSTIGATTPSTGAFTTLSATGVTTLSNAVLPVIDNIKLGYTTTATAAGTTTLTSASNNQQFFTGSTTQTVVLPVTSTLALGLSYLIVNNSTGVVTVQSSGANTITLIPANASVRCTCILITGTTAASWSFAFEGSSNIPYKQIPTITATVASNILTLGLNPCSLDFRSSTASSGATTTRNVTASISMTVSNGSTLGTSSGVLSIFAVLAIDNAGTVELAVVNANGYGFLDERVLISTTAEGGTGTADSGTVIYSTTARTSVPFRVVGYIQSTQATAGAYASSPSNIAGAGSSISKGTLLQVVTSATGALATGTTTIPFDDTIPQITEGTEFMTLAITPSSATSTLIIQVTLQIGGTAADWTTVALFQDSTASALAATTSNLTANYGSPQTFTYKMTAGTTSSTTFRVRAGAGSAGTITVNGTASARRLGGVMASTMTIYEVAV